MSEQIPISSGAKYSDVGNEDSNTKRTDVHHDRSQTQLEFARQQSLDKRTKHSLDKISPAGSTRMNDFSLDLNHADLVNSTQPVVHHNSASHAYVFDLTVHDDASTDGDLYQVYPCAGAIHPQLPPNYPSLYVRPPKLMGTSSKCSGEPVQTVGSSLPSSFNTAAIRSVSGQMADRSAFLPSFNSAQHSHSASNQPPIQGPPIGSLQVHQEVTLPQTSATSLRFADLDEAEAWKNGRRMDWQPLIGDATVPKNAKYRSLYVLELLDAFKDISEANDASKSYSKRWLSTIARNEYPYSEEAMEYVCMKLVAVTERLHTNGPSSLTIFDDVTMKNVRLSKSMTFRQRMTAMVDCLRESKARVDTLMKGQSLETFVATAATKLAESIANRKGNKTKQARISAGEQAQLQQIKHRQQEALPAVPADLVNLTSLRRKYTSRQKQEPGSNHGVQNAHLQLMSISAIAHQLSDTKEVAQHMGPRNQGTLAPSDSVPDDQLPSLPSTGANHIDVSSGTRVDDFRDEDFQFINWPEGPHILDMTQHQYTNAMGIPMASVGNEYEAAVKLQPTPAVASTGTAATCRKRSSDMADLDGETGQEAFFRKRSRPIATIRGR